MERIHLNKDEKTVLRMIAGGITVCPAEYPQHKFRLCIRSLERKGLVKGYYVEGGGVEECRLTSEGKIYLSENPYLNNPVNWSMWAAIGSLITAILSLAALFKVLLISVIR